MEREYTPEDPAEVVTPDAFVELILNFGTPYRLHTPGTPDREMPRAIVVGLHRKPLISRCDGTVKLVATRFFAWGALPFLVDSAPGAENPRTTLGREWGEVASSIEPTVAAGDHAAALAVIEDHLIEKLLVATVDLK